MFINILIGLLGLGLVVMIHEYGHLLLAKMVGVGVRTFSIGWGRRLFSFTRGETEYRISIFPIGGYVRLKGEEALTEAYANKERQIAQIPHGFFSAAPWRRIAIAIGGPLFNVIAAIVMLTIIFTIGYPIATHGNRIVLASEFDEREYAADRAGLASGDRVISIDGVETDYFFQIRDRIIAARNAPLAITVERDGQQRVIEAHGELDSTSGVTVLGIYPWIDPVVEAVTPGQSAEVAGIMARDVIIAVNGEPVEHAAQFDNLLRQHSTAVITVLRGASEREFSIAVGESEGERPTVGVVFPTLRTRTPQRGVGGAMVQAVREVGRVFRLTIGGLRAIFSGARVNNVIAGPIQLTSMIGNVTRSGAETGAGGVGGMIRLFFNFLAIINVALCIMNLLPIPILDGGQILLYAVEWVRRKKLTPRTIIRYQQAGGVCVILLLILALTSDFLFLFN